jgi:N-acetylglucosamine-6-phosphate deacetylase
MKIGLIKNCSLVSPDIEIDGATIEIHDNVIHKIYEPGTPLPKADWIHDAAEQFVMPGFIDIHTHGALGYDITDDDPKAVTEVARAKLAEGVTSFCPTTLTLSEEQLSASVQRVADYKKTTKYSKVIGVHLEGPFINSGALGAQNPAFVRKPALEEVLRLNAICKISQVTYAAEVDGGVDFARQLIDNGIVPSCGHSKCTCAQFKAAYAAGLRHLTHFCNQMTPLHHRDIGLVGAGLLIDDVMIEMICDKIHLCPEMIELAFQVKDIEKIALITDSMRASHLPDGKSSIGGLDVEVKNGVARLVKDGALAGSTLKLNDALKNAWEVTGLPLGELVKATSWNQARELGIDNLGRIEPGFIADIVILDEETFAPVAVFIDGEKRL